MTLTVPPEIDRVILEFDARTDPFEPLDVSQALSLVPNALGDLDEAAHRGRFAEWAAFNFMPSFQGTEPWGTFFRPMTTFAAPDGGQFYQPDLASIDAEIVEQWRARSQTLTNPVLKARYADLAWDLGAKVPSAGVRREMAATATDAYAAIALQAGRNDHDAIQEAERGLRLALQIRDAERVALARNNLLALHRRFFAAGDCRLEPFDALIAPCPTGRMRAPKSVRGEGSAHHQEQREIRRQSDGRYDG